MASHTGGGPRTYLAVMAFLPYWPLAVLAFSRTGLYLHGVTAVLAFSRTGLIPPILVIA